MQIRDAGSYGCSSVFYDEEQQCEGEEDVKAEPGEPGTGAGAVISIKFRGLRAHLQNIDENIQDIDKHCKATLERLEALKRTEVPTLKD